MIQKQTSANKFTKDLKGDDLSLLYSDLMDQHFLGSVRNRCDMGNLITKLHIWGNDFNSLLDVCW